MFDTKKPIRIKTNIFDLAIKACLFQEHKSNQYPVAYFLRKLLLAEQNYNIYNKKLLAIIVTLET